MKKGTILIIIAFVVLTLVSLSFAQVQQPVKQPQPLTPVAPSTPQQGAPPQIPPEIKPIDPGQLQKFKTMPSRSMVINTLMGNPSAKAMLESAAKGAGMNVNELATKGLDKKPTQTSSIVSPMSKIEELNWNGGITFSLIKNRPTFLHPESNNQIRLGNLSLWGVLLDNLNPTYSFDNDIFRCEHVTLGVYLPKGYATYMITVQGIIPSTTRIYTKSGIGNVIKYPNFYPLGNSAGVSGIVQLHSDLAPGRTFPSTANIYIHFLSAYSGSFGSITIMRL